MNDSSQKWILTFRKEWLYSHLSDDLVANLQRISLTANEMLEFGTEALVEVYGFSGNQISQLRSAFNKFNIELTEQGW